MGTDFPLAGLGKWSTTRRPLGGALTPLIQGADDHYRLRLRDRVTHVNPLRPEYHLDDCSCGRDHGQIAQDRILNLSDSDACWQWLLKPNKDGYGKLWHNRRSWSAHRFVYEAMHVRIPDGLVLDHLCRNRICVNPAHLEPVTNEENIRRGEGRLPVSERKREHLALTNVERRSYRSRSEFLDDDPRHGTTAGYSGLGCRCQPCKDAHNAAYHEYRARRHGGAA